MALEAAGDSGTSNQPMREVDAGEILEKVKAGQPVEYDHVIIKGDLDLSWKRLNKNITSPIRINDSIFDGRINFNDAILEMPVDLSGSNFSKNANFRRTIFLGYAIFRETTFSSNVYIGWASFRGGVVFEGATFSGYAEFEGATFSVFANFKEATFSGYANFLGTTFSSYTEFKVASFSGIADFCGANFSGDTGFDEAAYLALIKNYNALGWYGDASDCYYDYRNAVRKNWPAASAPGLDARLSSLLDRLVDFLEWILYGYGVRPSFPIAWSALIILAFGLFFRQKRCLRKIITEEKIEDAKDGSEEVLVKITAIKAEVNALDPFLFSLFTFTSGFTAFLHPSIEYKLERCVRWAIFERLLGPFFLALVITTISKTYLIR
jgi:uncharacterized protein YjbI with pentapeptide repeats